MLPTIDPNGVTRACDAIGVDRPVAGRLAGSPTDPLEPVWLMSEAGERLSIVWPQGFSVEFAPQVLLRNERGGIVAAAGDGVELQVSRGTAAGTFADPYFATGILFEGCYLARTVIEAGVFVATVADRVRVRSRPGIGDDSQPYEPLLPVGTPLYVLSGPVPASGYSWFEVLSVSLDFTAPGVCGGHGPCDGIYIGWVSAASRSGEPWLAVGTVACPAVPADALTLARLPLGARLACFSERPISIRARLVPCGCDFDGGAFDPLWFGVQNQPLLLADPSEASLSRDYRDWLILTLDPAGQHPDVLPVGQIVDVTGIFDHPAARTCLYSGVPVESAGPPTPTSDCRLLFVTTSIAAIEH